MSQEWEGPNCGAPGVVRRAQMLSPGLVEINEIRVAYVHLIPG